MAHASLCLHQRGARVSPPPRGCRLCWSPGRTRTRKVLQDSPPQSASPFEGCRADPGKSAAVTASSPRTGSRLPCAIPGLQLSSHGCNCRPVQSRKEPGSRGDREGSQREGERGAGPLPNHRTEQLLKAHSDRAQSLGGAAGRAEAAAAPEQHHSPRWGMTRQSA